MRTEEEEKRRREEEKRDKLRRCARRETERERERERKRDERLEGALESPQEKESRAPRAERHELKRKQCFVVRERKTRRNGTRSLYVRTGTMLRADMNYPVENSMNDCKVGVPNKTRLCTFLCESCQKREAQVRDKPS